MADLPSDFPLDETEEFSGGSGVPTGRLAYLLNLLANWVNGLFTGVWRDMQGDVRAAFAQAALTIEEYRDANLRLGFFRHDQDDAADFVFQFQHDWDRGVVRPHAHIIPMANGSGDAVFEFEAAWSKYGEELPAAAGWTTGLVTHSIVAADQHKQTIVPLGDFIPPANAKESSFLLIRFQRSGLHVNDTYTAAKSPGTAAANIALLGFDVHYQTNKLGTPSEIPT